MRYSAMFVRKVRETSLREFVEVVVDRNSGDVRVHLVEYFLILFKTNDLRKLTNKYRC